MAIRYWHDKIWISKTIIGRMLMLIGKDLNYEYQPVRLMTFNLHIWYLTKRKQGVSIYIYICILIRRPCNLHMNKPCFQFLMVSRGKDTDKPTSVQCCVVKTFMNYNNKLLNWSQNILILFICLLTLWWPAFLCLATTAYTDGTIPTFMII